MRTQLVQAQALSPARRRSRWIQRSISTLLVTTIVAAVVGTLVRAWPTSSASYEPQLREFTLTASEFDWELQPGTTVRAWGYNQQMPGPEIRVREGDRVRVTLINQLPVGTTIHWHGVMVPPEMDGPAGLNQAPVEPGETFVYDFIAKPAGTRWYHSHTDVVNQVALGLYGAFIVDPATPPSVTYDKEYTYMLAEWDLELTPGVAEGVEPRGARDSQLRGGELGTDLFLMNGHTNEAIPPIKVKTGDRILIRLINAGSMSHPIHLHGHLFKIVATDGNPVPADAQLTKDTVLIAPGERYDLEFVANNPGVWMVHCHIENHAANGMMTLIEYDGATPTGPLGEYWGADNATPMMDHSGHGGAMYAESPTPVLDATYAATPVASTSDGSGETVAMLDDRFAPVKLTVKAGTTVTWVNKGGNFHTVSALDGSFASGMIDPGKTFSFTFTTPGTYKYLCRQHTRHGMIGTIVVEP